jgi:hypothetical protein
MEFREIGHMIIVTLEGVAYFVVAGVIIKDILSCISKKDVEGIIKAILSGVIGYGSIFAVTKILDKVKDVMK